MLFEVSEIARLQPSEAIKYLRDDFNHRYSSNGMRLCYSPELSQERDEAIRIAYSQSEGSSTIFRRARVLEVFCKQCSIVTRPEDYLLGTLAYNGPCFVNGNSVPEYACTTGHIVHDYESLLKYGISGLKEIVSSATAEFTYQENARKAYLLSLQAFETFIQRHVDSIPDGSMLASRHIDELQSLSIGPPTTFFGAIQLLWFAHILLHIENPSVAISFGRIDQYLYPFLDRDLAVGAISILEAFDLICALMLKCCEGEESQNVVLGGAGDENLVSYLMLSAMKSMRAFQPSISVRIGKDTSEEFMQACTDLSIQGTGNPGFMNEDLVIRSLVNTGIRKNDARDWSVVGCYEATISGKCYPNTVLGRLNLPRLLSGYVNQLDSTPTDFEQFVKGFETYTCSAYESHLEDVQNQWMVFRDKAPSPFGSVLMRGSRERLVPVESGGTQYNLVGVNMLGLGSLIDGLLAIKHSIYETDCLSLAEIRDGLASNFADDIIRIKLRKHPQRYGIDDIQSQELISGVSSSLARMVLDSRLYIESSDCGPSVDVQPYPAFFGFSGDIYDTDFPSVDGRRVGELISYGIAPPLSSFISSTAALQSASFAAQRLAACGSPFALTLSESEADPDIIGELVQAYFEVGGFHLHINIADTNTLRESMVCPEEHQDVMVRISGFSAKFVTLDKKWQQALVDRAEKGH